MARNEEKAQSMLYRWRELQNEEIFGPKKKRPYLASECRDLPEAEKWRQEIIREISKKVSIIQNPGLGEFKIRDLNDEINKLLREKNHWEEQIRLLGGTDYKKFGPKMLDKEGKEVPGMRGYKYFGAAKDLPGVRELFEQAVQVRARKTRGQLYKGIDADYYGYRDDDDGVLLPLEQAAEEEARAKAIAKWNAEQLLKKHDPQGYAAEHDEEEDIYAHAREPQPDEESDDEGRKRRRPAAEEAGMQFVAHVPVPSQQDVEKIVLERKKRELMEKYLSEDLKQVVEETKELTGKA
eukprot:Colp12_sorted_trinity150504_noHs@30396